VHKTTEIRHKNVYIRAHCTKMFLETSSKLPFKLFFFSCGFLCSFVLQKMIVIHEFLARLGFGFFFSSPFSTGSTLEFFLIILLDYIICTDECCVSNERQEFSVQDGGKTGIEK